MRFRITDQPVEAWLTDHPMHDDAAGAVATFEGRVRNHHEGRAVRSLEYEAFIPLAESEGETILEEARTRFDVIDIRAVHRHWHLQIGEIAVWVGVLAAHRKEAFAACRWVIDEIKHRLPVWKKEYYESGEPVWVNCQGCAETHTHEAALYARQMILPEVGNAGQQKLKTARVLLIGAGGLGCPVLQYLAAAGVGTVGISEFDSISADNLHRQVLYGVEDIGAPKLKTALEKLAAQNPFVQFQAHEKLAPKNAEGLFTQYDLVLDCTDNFESKFLINDAAVLTQTPALHASLYQYEGQLYGCQPGKTACLRCLWPETPSASCTGNCEESGILGAVAGSIGSMQGMEALKFLLGMPSVVDSGEWITINLLTNDMQKIVRPANPGCPACTKPKNIRLGEQAEVAAESLTPQDLVIHLNRDLSPYMKNDRYTFPRDRRIILVCRRGHTSLTLTKQLRAEGWHNVYSLAGGESALAAWTQPTPV